MLSGVFSMTLLPGILCFSLGTLLTQLSSSSATHSVIRLLLCVGLIAAIGLGIFLLVISTPKRLKELREMHNELRQQSPSLDKKKEIIEVFGKKTLDELLQIKSDHEKEINEVMGQIDNYEEFLLMSG
jgi:hypothetical protein